MPPDLTPWISPAILIGGFLYLAAIMRSLKRHLRQMESRLDVRISSLETQIGDFRGRLDRIEARLAGASDPFIGTGSGPGT